MLAKLETVYTGSGDHGSSMVCSELNLVLQFKFNSLLLIMNCLILQFVLTMEQGLPLLPEWLSFTRVNARARKGVEIGPARLHLRSEIHAMKLTLSLIDKGMPCCLHFTLIQNNQSHVLPSLIGSLVVSLVVIWWEISLPLKLLQLVEQTV